MPGPKSAVPEKLPVAETLPDPSTAIEADESLRLPPRRRAQAVVPEASSRATNASHEPALVSEAPGPKSAVPEKSPITYTAPDPATATDLAMSTPFPPMRRAQ